MSAVKLATVGFHSADHPWISPNLQLGLVAVTRGWVANCRQIDPLPQQPPFDWPTPRAHTLTPTSLKKCSYKIGSFGGMHIVRTSGCTDVSSLLRQKWQRRFFVLYEHGCLRFALDESVSRPSSARAFHPARAWLGWIATGSRKWEVGIPRKLGVKPRWFVFGETGWRPLSWLAPRLRVLS